MRTIVSIVVATFLLNAVALPAQAQTSHAAPQSALDAAVQARVAASAADRETVQRLLERPEVQAIAGDAGVDLRGVRAAVSILDAQQLSAIAAQASQIDQSLAGGQSNVTISTTMIIIGLLVLILIIVAVN
jgi:hypothetical protein